jgi:hypothetical protein
MVLLHELGHHMFASSKITFHSSDRLAFSESLANWFCYQMLSSWERDLLWGFSQRQSPVYRLYSGWVLLRQREELPVYTDKLILSAYRGNRVPRMRYWRHFDVSFHCHPRNLFQGMFAALYLLEHLH